MLEPRLRDRNETRIIPLGQILSGAGTGLCHPFLTTTYNDRSFKKSKVVVSSNPTIKRVGYRRGGRVRDIDGGVRVR